MESNYYKFIRIDNFKCMNEIRNKRISNNNKEIQNDNYKTS